MDTAATFSTHALLSEAPLRAPGRPDAATVYCRLAAGDTSNAAEDEGMAVFVVAGTVRASYLVDGRILFQDVEADGAYGLIDAVLGRSSRPVSLLALTEAQIFVLPAETILAEISASARASMALAKYFAKALDSAATADPLRLVYRDILRAAKPMGDAMWTVDPMPRHRELAQRAGVGEEEAASAIANLVRLGVARRRYPALDIEDRDALRSLAG